MPGRRPERDGAWRGSSVNLRASRSIRPTTAGRKKEPAESSLWFLWTLPARRPGDRDGCRTAAKCDPVAAENQHADVIVISPGAENVLSKRVDHFPAVLIVVEDPRLPHHTEVVGHVHDRNPDEFGQPTHMQRSAGEMV